VNLVGVLPVPEDQTISAAAGVARKLRKEMRSLDNRLSSGGPLRVRVTHTPIEELLMVIQEEKPDLLILEWPVHFEAFKVLPGELLNRTQCNTALVRGPWPKKMERIVVPMRGGPFAELTLRLGMALPSEQLEAVNIYSSASSQGVEAPFRGLASILPRLPGVKFRRIQAGDLMEGLLNEGSQADLVLIGATARRDQPDLGSVAERVLMESQSAVAVLKSSESVPELWTGTEGERAGTQAISVLVDRWFAENTYHADEFAKLEQLVKLKEAQGVTISLALPALNEEKTVGTVIQTVKKALYDDCPLLDEIVLIDSNSTDRTREIAGDLGIPVYIHQELLPSQGPRRGKGEALWKSLQVTSGDIIVWIDTDIVNIHPRFVYGVIGPMLVSPSVQYVKGFYRRPLRQGKQLQAGGGGRVTELTARPMLNLFYPELSGVIQPLSGEYGGRRKALEQLPFFSGYGVEIGMLIDLFEKFGLSAIAQVDLLERIHHNQPLEALSKMSFAILQAVMRKLEGRFERPVLEEVNKTMKLVHYARGNYFLDVEEVSEQERPPMLEVPEYRSRPV
jgi:glucosyl-3-phosphoglycerate synthase